MGVVGAFMVPHPPLIIPEVGQGRESGIADTVRAYERVADMVAELQPDTIVVATPHSIMYSDYIHISPGGSAEGSFEKYGAADVGFGVDYDVSFVRKLCMHASEQGIDAGTSGQKDPKLDHATLIPLYFITQKYVDFDLVRIGISGLPMAEHYRLGMVVKQTAEELNRRVVFIGSGDLSHKLSDEGPYGYIADGPVYDERIMDVMGRAAFDELFNFDELFLEKVAECGHRAFVMMAGALDRTAVLAERLSHEGPYGVGYGVCAYKVLPDQDGFDRNFLDKFIMKESSRLSRKKKREDLYVRLARKSLESYVKFRKEISYGEVCDEIVDEYIKDISTAVVITDDMSDEEKAGAHFDKDAAKLDSFKTMMALERNKAGVFVSLHKDGRLRGCIGTIAPTKDSIADEIIENAIAAATRDRRFEPVTVSEIKYLEYSVDVLSPAEKIDSPDQLDVNRYGVIVTNGSRRGLLLPNLDTIDTVEEQIAVAKKKAQIGEDEPVELQRFEVVRHY